MRIAYVNANYMKNHTGGGHVHIEQFLNNATQMGHEIWTYPGSHHPKTRTIPTGHLKHIRTMHTMDAMYVRLELQPPAVCRWAVPPRRLLYGFPVVVWEFNTIPDEGYMRGQPKEIVNQAKSFLRYNGKGCDLAVCMTKSLGDYVKNELGIKQVLIVPNGSDPGLFRPDAPTVSRMDPFQGKFNVVWIGSARFVYHDFDLLREAAQFVCERGWGDRINFHIIGPGLVGAMGNMPPNVFYWGAEQYQKLPHWLAAMDVGLYLSNSDLTQISTPLKLFDYLASGLTVISTSQPVFIQELFDVLGQTDLLIPPGDAAYLADCIINLSSNRERVSSLGAAGRQLVIKQYNWRRAVKDTMHAMENILKEKGIKPKA